MFCQIRVKGHLSSSWSEWFGGLTITNLDNGEAVISGELPDQAALYGVLSQVHALNLPLLSLDHSESVRQDTASPADANTEEAEM